MADYTIVVQPLAVLLLEMVHQGMRVSGKHSDVSPYIKKLIRWLRAMRHNDSVVARAYEVVCKILRSCALPSQAKANELLADDFEVTLQAQPFQYFLDLSEQEQTGQLPQTDSIGNSAANPTALDSNLFQEQLLDPFLAYQPASTPYPKPGQIRVLIPFGTPFVMSADQGAPALNMQHLWLDLGLSEDIEMQPSLHYHRQLPQDSGMDHTRVQQQQLPLE